MWNNPGKIHFYDAFFSKVIQKLTDTCIGILVGECKQVFRYNASFIYAFLKIPSQSVRKHQRGLLVIITMMAPVRLSIRHCRRKFHEALEVIPKDLRKQSVLYLIMNQIRAIYREEGKFSGLSSDERTAKRQLVVKPLVDAFFAYLKQNSDRVSKSVKIKEAFAYALNQERYLRVFLENGDVPMDNNSSERAIRGFCIGKKN